MEIDFNSGTKKKKGGDAGGFTLVGDLLVFLQALDRQNRDKDFDRGRGALRKKIKPAKPKPTTGG